MALLGAGRRFGVESASVVRDGEGNGARVHFAGDFDGITVEDVHARRAARVINVQGNPDLPLRNLTVRTTTAEVVDRPDAIENADVAVVTNVPIWEGQTRLSEGRPRSGPNGHGL